MDLFRRLHVGVPLLPFLRGLQLAQIKKCSCAAGLSMTEFRDSQMVNSPGAGATRL